MHPVPVSLITGFLGSGKTTLLRHLLTHRPEDRLWACVVNDFGAVDVDGTRLADTGAVIFPIAGGSIFCQCLVTEFLNLLRKLQDFQAQHPLEGVLIEASGMADPRAINRLLRDTSQDQHFSLQSIVTVVDPGTFSKLRHTLPNLQAQIESAHHLVLNKADCHSSDLIQTTGAALRTLNPTALLHTCSFGRVDLNPLISETQVRFQPGAAPPHPGRDTAFASCVVTHQAAIDATAFRKALNQVQQHLYRIKGHLRLDHRWQAVDYSDTGLMLRPVADADPPPQLVFIYPSHHEEHIRQTLLRPLAQGRFDINPAPKSQAE